LLAISAFLCISAGCNRNRSPVGDKNKAAIGNDTVNRYDIGGYSLYADIRGEGSPTVIFESGGGDESDAWKLVQPEIAKITRTLSYDRAGLGKSDRSPLPRTSREQVRELRALLDKAEVKPPYIFVANSYGAFISSIFANTYPDLVAGVVFVDGTNEKLPEYVFENVPFLKLLLYKLVTRGKPDGSLNEFHKSGQEVKEAEKSDGLRNTPVVVLSSDVNITAKQFANSPFRGAASHWMSWQKQLAAQSNKSKQYMIYGSGHMIHKERPKVVISAIERLLKNEYDWNEAPAGSPPVISLPAGEMRQYAGRYLYSADEVMTINEENGRFFAHVPYRPVAEIFPISGHRIWMKDIDTVAELRTGRGAKSDCLVMWGAYAMDTVRAPRMDEGDHTPSEYLAVGRIDDAVAAYKEIQSRDPLEPAIVETRLNELGYDLLNNSKTNEAIAIFKLNTQLYPESANAYDSLGEAYKLGGNKELAIKNYERSLELDPHNTNAAKQLKKL
jgi:hypothetical protein